MDCIFCKIVSGQISARLIKETIHSIAFLDAFQLSEFFASCSASILTYLKARAGCIEFMDAYASLASISKSDADLSFGAQNAAKASKFDWDSFRRRSSSSLFELTQLESLGFEFNKAKAIAPVPVPISNTVSISVVNFSSVYV